MKRFFSIMLMATLSLSACGNASESVGQNSSTAPSQTMSSYETAPQEEKPKLIKGKSLDKIGYKCEAPLDLEIEEDIFLDIWSSTGGNSGDMRVNEILGEDAYTLISVLFYGPHSLGSEPLNFMYLQAFSTIDAHEKNSIKIGGETYTFKDLQPYLVFKTDDIYVYDVYKLTDSDNLQTQITKWVDIHNEMVTKAINATAQEKEKYHITMTEKDYVTYEDYNYLHNIAEYYKTNIGDLIVKK